MINDEQWHGAISLNNPDHSIMVETCHFWHTKFPAKTACPGKIWLIFEKIFRATRRLFWMNHLVYSQFLEFRPSYRLHIAYFDCSKWCSRFGIGITHVLHLDHSIITLHWYKKTCFDQFLAIFSSLVNRINFILHILMFLNSVHDLAMVSNSFCAWIIQ